MISDVDKALIQRIVDEARERGTSEVLHDVGRAFDDGPRREAARAHALELLSTETPVTSPTPYARERIAKMPVAASWLRANRPRGATKAAMADRLGIDRDSIDRWIEAGWTSGPPEWRDLTDMRGRNSRT